VDDVALALQKSVHAVRQVAGNLFHPGAVWLARDACDLNAPASQIDHELHEVADQTIEGQHLDREEVHRGDDTEMAWRKVLRGMRLPRIGAGSRPWSRRMRLIVLRPTSCPRSPRAPRILV
jgi:hypothetical protein